MILLKDKTKNYSIKKFKEERNINSCFFISYYQNSVKFIRLITSLLKLQKSPTWVRETNLENYYNNYYY